MITFMIAKILKLLINYYAKEYIQKINLINIYKNTHLIS